MLIIGSLLWDGGVRPSWRDERLDLANRIPVLAPIRYGRRSENRSDTFTMVLDPDCPNGRAIVAPCLNEILAFPDLLEEAEALWMAERDTHTRAGISATWGCVGGLFSPEITENFSSGWSAHFRASAEPVEPVDSEGILGVAWPRRCSDGGNVDLDVILATATCHEPTPPSTEEIARAWAKQTKGEERYFIENIRSDIRTSSDEAIWNHLMEMSPSWLDDGLRHEVSGYLMADD